MNWDTPQLILQRLTGQLGFLRTRPDDYRDKAKASMSDQGTDERSTLYHPDFREKRHEFSQHIGC